jgi:hypothetical protein
VRGGGEAGQGKLGDQDGNGKLDGFHGTVWLGFDERIVSFATDALG